MSVGGTNRVRTLLAEAARPAGRREARAAWVRETAAAWREAQREMDDRCSEAVGRMSEEAFERFCDAEQVRVDVVHAPLRAVVDKDLWPRELYWRDV